jgi:hypothetical protein
MRAICVLTTTILFLTATLTHATILRVSNLPGVNAPYSAITTAVAAASAGDTILVEGSPNTYAAVSLTKRLRIFGPGSFLPNNPNTQAIRSVATVASITFSSGSAGSVVSGMTSIFTVNTNDITIRRNYIPFGNASPITTGINVGVSVINLLIEQNFIIETGADGDYSWLNAINFNNNITPNCIIKNNIIIGMAGSGNGLIGGVHVNVASNSLIFLNNVFRGNIACNNSGFTNNIVISGVVSGTYNNFSNNIGNSTQFGTLNGNQQNVTMANVFVAPTGAIDNQFVLKAGSPALNAAAGGGDCGAFSNDSGASSYVLSTMPTIPHIYEATVPASATNTLNVRIKAVSQN